MRAYKFLPLLITALAIPQVHAASYPVKTDSLPKTSVHVGYAFNHQNYVDSWKTNYLALVGTTPPNNYQGVVLGLTQMLNDWVALNIGYKHFLRKGNGNGDARLSGLRVAGMGFKEIQTNLNWFGEMGANVGAVSHNGDGGINSTNRSSQHADINFFVATGVQYKVNELVSIRTDLNFTPFQDRTDAKTGYGFQLSAVFNLDK
jgi:hypothetical protein